MVIAFRREGYETEAAESGEQALGIVSHRHFDLVVTDLRLAGMDGIQVLKQVKVTSPDTEVVVMTGYGSIEGAVEAIKSGAYDYLTKPFHPQELILVARRALERQGLSEKARVLEEALRDHSFPYGIVGTSEAIKHVLGVVEQVAQHETTVLITGETGTGKELVARALHAQSPRKDKPLVVVNCGTIVESLQESELFGHARGAFTGAHSDKRGLFEEAHGGTAFLDEIGELSPTAQVKLLRFLQDGETRKVGTTVSRNLDVHVIAATNRDLAKCVEEKLFREDLYYRVNVIPIRLPPLRERSEDIPHLVHHFTKLAADRVGVAQSPPVSPRAMGLLQAQPWRGNIRELQNVVERAVALDQDGIIGLDDLPFTEKQETEHKVMDNAVHSSPTLRELKREFILEVLASCRGSRVKTAEQLGITPATLWRKLKRYESQD
jgi:DNA-binding NtrC family response regulator